MVAIKRFNEQAQHSQTGMGVLKEILHNKEINRICVAIQNGYQVLRLEDILYAEAANTYTVFHMLDGEQIVSSKPIREYDQIFPGSRFLRIHRSFLINLQHIKQYKKGRGGLITMVNGTELEVSRFKREQLLNHLGLK